MPETGLVATLKRALNLAQDDTPIEPEESSDSIAYQMPYDMGVAEKVGRRLWRKQVAPFRSVKVRGESLDFTRDKAEAIKRNFEGKAFDQVPFVLGHTDDPESSRGEVKGFEVTNDGLDALLETDERGSELISHNPKLGVSMRYIEDYSRESDGTHFGPMVQHVAATFTPVMNGMKPWEAVEASAQDREVVDLSDEEYEVEETEEAEETEGGGKEVSAEDEELIQEVVQEMSEQDYKEGVDLATATTDPAVKGDSVTFSRGGQTMKGMVQSVDDKGIASIKLADGSMTKAPVSTLKVAPDADDSGAKNGGKNMSEEGSIQLSGDEREEYRQRELEFSDRIKRLERDNAHKDIEARLDKEFGMVAPALRRKAKALLFSEACEEGNKASTFDLSEDGHKEVRGDEKLLSDQVWSILDHVKRSGGKGLLVELGERGVVAEDGTHDLSDDERTKRYDAYQREHSVDRRAAIKAVEAELSEKFGAAN